MLNVVFGSKTSQIYLKKKLSKVNSNSFISKALLIEKSLIVTTEFIIRVC